MTPRRKRFRWQTSVRWMRFAFVMRALLSLAYLIFLYLGVRERIWILVVAASILSVVNGVYSLLAWRQLRRLEGFG